MKLQWLKQYGNVSRTDESSRKINLCVKSIDLDKDNQTYERTGSSIYSIKKMENNKTGSILTPYKIMCSKSWWGGSMGKAPAVKPDNLSSISRTRKHLPLWGIVWPPHMYCAAHVYLKVHTHTHKYIQVIFQIKNVHEWTKDLYLKPECMKLFGENTREARSLSSHLGRRLLERDRSTGNKSEIRQMGREQVTKLSRAQEVGL